MNPINSTNRAADPTKRAYVPHFTREKEEHLKFADYVYPVNDGGYRIENKGLIQEVGIFSGKKNGPGRIVTPDGKEYVLSYENNIPQGSVTRGDSHGNKLIYTVVDGCPLGKAVEKLKNREIEFMFGANGLRDGDAIETNSYGKIEFKYKNGVRQPSAKIMGNDGKIYYLYYWKDKPNGHAIIFLPNGKIIYCAYNNGYPEGEARMVLPNKNEFIFNYTKGIPQGHATEIFNKGSAYFTLVDGIRVGPVQFYSNPAPFYDSPCNLLGVPSSSKELIEYSIKYGSSIIETEFLETLYIHDDSSSTQEPQPSDLQLIPQESIREREPQEAATINIDASSWVDKVWPDNL